MESCTTPRTPKIILAGGISAENVKDFIAQKPDVIDLSGSLESEKGVKSLLKLREFFDIISNI